MKLQDRASVTLFRVFDRECVVRRIANDTDRHVSEHFEKMLVLFLVTLNFLKLQDRVENIYLMISIYVKSPQKKKQLQDRGKIGTNKKSV